MQLSIDEVRKIARLARLELTDAELEKYASQLTNILTYVGLLQELDLNGVKETSQVTGLSSVFRPDVVGEPLCTPDELLACSPLPKDDHQIRVKRVI